MTRGGLTPWTEPQLRMMHFECERCGAPVDWPCRSPSGAATQPHACRVRAARDAGLLATVTERGGYVLPTS